MTAFKIGDRIQIVYDAYWRKALPQFHMQTGIVNKVCTEHVLVVTFDDVFNAAFPSIRVSAKYLKLIPTVIKVGDRVRCTADLIMLRNRPRAKDEIFEVLDGEQAYYQWAVERGDYELLPPLPQYFVLARKWMPNNTYDSHRWYSHSLAECIAYAQMQVEENGRETATVHTGEEIRSLFISARDLTGKVICIKSAECNATTAEIADALRKYVRGELGE